MSSSPLLEKRSAIFSEDRRYRRMLRITWDETKPLIAFVGLNPSTADEYADDATIRRCKSFAADWGYGSLVMLNLFEFKATDPREMQAAESPEGFNADGSIADVGLAAAQLKVAAVVACWGTGGRHRDRGRIVTEQLWKHFGGYRLLCFGRNADGSPKHPLYLRTETGLVEFGPVHGGMNGN